MLRARLLPVLVLLFALIAPGTVAAWAHDEATVDGRASHGTVLPHDGIKIFLRYQNPGSLYAVYFNRRDGQIGVQRKFQNATGEGRDDADDYTRLETSRPLIHEPVYGQPQRITASAVDTPEGHVEIFLFLDGELAYSAIDRGHTPAGPPIRSSERVGLRTDNLEFTIDEIDVRAAGGDGRPTGPSIVHDGFDYPDGLVTNQRVASVANATWLVTSGSLFARDGQGWSGVPDDVNPDPESRYANGASVFRMVTQRDDLRDVAVSTTITNHGYVADPAEVEPMPRPHPPHYPTGEQAVAVDRREGRSNAHTAISVSRRAFAGARDVVLIDADPQPEALAAPGLAGKVGGPVLLTPRGGLHPDTAAEIRRLGARRVHLVGDFSAAVSRDLSAAGVSVRRYGGATPEAVSAEVAGTVGGDGIYLAVTDDWGDATSISGAAAHRSHAVVLTPPDRLRAATSRALDRPGLRRVTVVGTTLAPEIVDELRARGLAVDHAGFSRYSVARASAQQQVAAGASPATVWLAPGARPFHVLVGGAAAAGDGGVLLSVDGNDLGDTSYDDQLLRGYESRHWARYHRADMRRLRPIGQTRALDDRVVGQVRAPVRTVLAGMTDIAGSAHVASIIWALEQDVATGYGDQTFRPGRAVTRGQMATLLAGALDLPPGAAPFDDVDGSVHEPAIGAVVAAGIADGFPDGDFRPAAPVSRAQMATFLTRALDLPPAAPSFSDVDGGTHADAIGAVAGAEIAGGYPDGTYRPGQPVTRAQMATFLQRAIDR